jgi:hypothetical protein
MHHARSVGFDDTGYYGNSYQILQTPGYVAIRYEMVHVLSPDGKKLFVGSSAPVGSSEPPNK